jgi:valyl-tRNA synthetase
LAQALIIAPYPEPRTEEGWEYTCIVDFHLIQETIRSIRNIRSEKNVRPGMRIPAVLSGGDKTKIFLQYKGVVAALAQVDPERFEITSRMPPKQEGQVAMAFGPVEIYLPLEGLVVASEENERLTKALNEAESQINRLEKLLASSFSDRAPSDIVQKEKDKLSDYRETVEKLKKQLAALE